ncbi:MAG: hypothetical protein RLY31_2933 [Bacteroidota bacterium]|jgi:hypothetical protein
MAATKYRPWSPKDHHVTSQAGRCEFTDMVRFCFQQLHQRNQHKLVLPNNWTGRSLTFLDLSCFVQICRLTFRCLLQGMISTANLDWLQLPQDCQGGPEMSDFPKELEISRQALPAMEFHLPILMCGCKLLHRLQLGYPAGTEPAQDVQSSRSGKPKRRTVTVFVSLDILHYGPHAVLYSFNHSKSLHSKNVQSPFPATADNGEGGHVNVPGIGVNYPSALIPLPEASLSEPIRHARHSRDV